MKPTKTIAFVSLCGCTAFVLIVCSLHFLRPDKNRLSCFVSEYAVGNYGWLMTIVFYTLAFASALLLIGLLQDCKVSATGCTTLGIFSIGILLAGIFPTDLPGEPPAPSGLIHSFAALIGLFSLGISMTAWRFVFRKNENLKSLAKPSILYGIVSLVLLIIFVGSPILFRGLAQRFLLIWDVGWLVLVGGKLYFIKTINLCRR